MPGGSAFSPDLQGRSTGDIPFYKVSDMNLPGNGWFMRRANNYVDEADRRSISGDMKPAGAVIFPKVGGAIHTNKKRLLSRLSFVDNNVMAVWSTDSERCRPDFLYLYFLTLNLSDLSNPGPLPSINSSKVEEQEILLPPPLEQDSIVAVLGVLQQAIDKENALYATTVTLKHAAKRDLFSHGLRGESQKETEIGLVPNSWDVIPLGSLGRIGNGSTPKKTNPAYWVDGTYPWLNSAKVYDREIVEADQFVTALALEECHLPRIKPGAVLMAITGQGKTLGHCAVLKFEATVNQHIAYLATDTQRAHPSFVRGYLETKYDYLRQVASGGGSTKGALTCAFLRDLPIPFTNMEEQREIVDILDAIDRKILLHQRKQALAEELFKSLLQRLMTGEIGVAELNISKIQDIQLGRASV